MWNGKFCKKDWKKASAEEILAEFERLRREFYKAEHEKNPRIQKILTIINKGKIVKVIDCWNK